MSELSFDTSAANTAVSITSGLSLGQCIKQTAEESQADQWFELQPTFEKEWHTLQGEPSSQVTDTGDLSELPRNVTKRQSASGSTKPVFQLLGQTNFGNTSRLTEESGGQNVASQMQKSTGNVKDLCLTSVSEPHYSTTHKMTRVPPEESLKIVEEPLTMEQLSNILEKDDSLAQRVQDLLDDDYERKSCESLDHVTVNSNTDNEYLKDPTVKASLTEFDVQEQDSAFTTLEGVDHSDTIDHNVPEMLKQTLPPFETDMDKIISCLSRKSDPFGSLNTSKSTEYGDLPDTVDIPPDIIQRLNNMRLLDKNNVSPKEAWVEPSSKTGISLDSQRPIEAVKDAKVESEAPISGNVQYHLGSNPSTPQFPIDEENLKQLQTYIEKKTGEPTISPLVAGSLIPQSHVNSTSPLVDGDYFKRTVVTPSLATVGEEQPVQQDTATSSGLNRLTVETSAIDPLLYPNSNVVDSENLKRSEPEGMSPPVVNAAGNLLRTTSSTAKCGEKQSLEAAGQIIRQTSLDEGKDTFPHIDKRELVSKDVSNAEDQIVDTSLADESILARIKSVLSESISRQHIGSSICAPSHGVVRSDASFASSVDSLAMQVKALLLEEVDNKNENPETSQANLSQVIENFEQTDLWKYVRQFLPPGDLNQEMEVQKDEDDTHANESSPDVSLNHTLLAKIRAEFEKEKAIHVPFVQGDSTKPLVEMLPTPQRQHTDVQNLTQRPETTSLQKTSVRMQQPNKGFKPGQEATGSPQTSHLVVENMLRTGKSHTETIPGIPDFSRSVYSPVEAEGKELKHLPVSGKEKNDVKGSFHAGNDVPSPNISVDKKTSDKLQLTLNWRLENPKDQDIRISSFRTEDSGSVNVVEHESATESQMVILPSDDEKSIHAKEENESSSRKKEKKSPFSCNSLNDVQQSFHTIPTHRFSSTPTKANEHSGQKFGFQPSGGILSSPSRSYKSRIHPQRSHRQTPINGSCLKSPQRKTSKTSPAKKLYDKNRSPNKSMLQDRITVHDWLSSPDRKQYKAIEKVLPTFDELMSKQESKEKKHNYDSHHLITTSKETKNEVVEKNPEDEHTSLPSKSNYSYALEEPTKLMSDRLLSTVTPATTARDVTPTIKKLTKDQQQQASQLPKTGPPSSLCLEVEENDSYQNLSATDNQVTSVQYDSSPLGSRLSDVEMHRRMLHQASSSDDRDVLLKSKSKTSLLSAFDDFHTLDENVQKQILKKLVELLQQKQKPGKKAQKVSTPSRDLFRPATMQPNLSVLHETSQNSNAAVCDSDSTEYCELPSSQQTTVVKEESSVRKVLGVDESKAEQIMKRLLKKIEKQKLDESRKSGRKHDKRRVVSSSTPERNHAPLILPEASSIASTDTDASKSVRYIHVKRHAPIKKKKVTYVEELSSSEPTIVKIKRKPKKSETVMKRVVLHDRSVQANVEEESSVMSHDIATNFPSPTPSQHKPKRSKRVQTHVSTENKENDGLNDTITIHSPPNKVQPSTKQGKKVPSDQRFSSFYVEFTKDSHSKKEAEEIIPMRESLAWYEPFKYQPPWMDTHKRNLEKEGLVRISLQEALSNNLPEFVSKSRERQRRITINAEERRLQEVWAEERQRVFGVKSDHRKQSKSTTAFPFKRRVELTRRQVVQETRDKYGQLPEVVKRKQEEERKREYATNRLKAQLFKKKVQNKILGKLFAD
uniref:Alstrom syndrome protein 1 homolog n=1 Tax=Phallusia mammillata TaxID=59560 RepID=A0A6F9D6T7_9ASCI|nr:Alstrom syndrome protein 1 homolog [Phallusia mammillata]